MSLKAKIEAVIYAADQPVSLAQLATIFGEEVLAYEAEAALPFEADPRDSTHPDDGTESHLEEIPASLEEIPAGDQPPLLIEEAEAKKRLRLRERKARSAVEKIVQELIAEYASGERGMEVREIAGGYRIATKAEYHDAVRAFVTSLKPQMKLSLQALETLAVVAYKQPVTAPEISEIRGVDTAGVLGGLMARKLITTAGRKQVIGRPILYKTTREFLLRFGLKDVGELPSIEEFEKMAADMAQTDLDQKDPADDANEDLTARDALESVTAANAETEAEIVDGAATPEAESSSATEAGTNEISADNADLGAPEILV